MRSTWKSTRVWKVQPISTPLGPNLPSLYCLLLKATIWHLHIQAPSARSSFDLLGVFYVGFLQAKMASSAPTLLTLDKTEAHSFMTPIQRIRDGEDVSAFLTSHAYRDLVTFLLQLNASMFPRYVHSSGSTKIQVWGNETPGVPFSKTVVGLRNLLCSLSKIIDMTPLDTGPRRFGNAAFKVWHDTVKIRVDDLLTDNLPAEILSFQNDSKMVALDELRAYFLGSFGSPQRLDYGTGHELSFLAFLGCIWKLGGFNTSSSGEEERGIVIGVIDLWVSRPLPDSFS